MTHLLHTQCQFDRMEFYLFMIKKKKNVVLDKTTLRCCSGYSFTERESSLQQGTVLLHCKQNLSCAWECEQTRHLTEERENKMSSVHVVYAALYVDSEDLFMFLMVLARILRQSFNVLCLLYQKHTEPYCKPWLQNFVNRPTPNTIYLKHSHAWNSFCVL